MNVECCHQNHVNPGGNPRHLQEDGAPTSRVDLWSDGRYLVDYIYDAGRLSHGLSLRRSANKRSRREWKAMYVTSAECGGRLEKESNVNRCNRSVASIQSLLKTRFENGAAQASPICPPICNEQRGEA